MSKNKAGKTDVYTQSGRLNAIPKGNKPKVNVKAKKRGKNG